MNSCSTANSKHAVSESSLDMVTNFLKKTVQALQRSQPKLLFPIGTVGDKVKIMGAIFIQEIFILVYHHRMTTTLLYM